MGIALTAVLFVGILVAFALAVQYYRQKVKRLEAEGVVIKRPNVQKDLDRIRRDEARYQEAQERARHATVSDAIDQWRAAKRRFDWVRRGGEGGPGTASAVPGREVPGVPGGVVPGVRSGPDRSRGGDGGGDAPVGGDDGGGVGAAGGVGRGGS